MKVWKKRTALAFATLLFLSIQASAVWARAGGGVGGSYGGSSGGSFSGGGFSGGFGGSSFSFFPFFFLGGGTGGGGLFGGFFSLLILLFILYIGYRMLTSRRRHQSGKSRPRQGQGGWQGGWKPAPPTSTVVDVEGNVLNNESQLQRFGKAVSFARENMRYFAETFSRWDREYLIGRVRQVFFWFQDAWSRQDLTQAGSYLHPDLIAKYQSDLDQIRRRGERYITREPMLNSDDVEFIYARLDESNERFVVMIYANLIDYTTDSTGRIIAGNDKQRLYFTEFWEFTWFNDQWVLTKIYQEDALEIAKIARGESL